MKIEKTLLVLLGILILGNLVFLDWWFIKNRFKAELGKTDLSREASQPASGVQETLVFECDQNCQKIVEEKVAEAVAKIPTQKPSKISSSMPTVQPSSKVTYIPLVSDGSTSETSWTDITPSDFYFNLTDYPGVKSARFEVYLKSKHQAGRIYLRLYDATNKRAVDFSDLSSSSESFELQRSSDLVIWQGNNLYRLQAKTLNGIEGYFKDAKLKITL